MTVKETLIRLFEENKGHYISGEEIAQELHCSRTAVWKAVNQLKEEGYEIEAVKNKGYMLSLESDVLSEHLPLSGACVSGFGISGDYEYE